MGYYSFPLSQDIIKTYYYPIKKIDFCIALSKNKPYKNAQYLSDINPIWGGLNWEINVTATIFNSSLYTEIQATDTLIQIPPEAIGTKYLHFRYAILYDKTHNNLLGYWDYGSNVKLYHGETFHIIYNKILLRIYYK